MELLRRIAVHGPSLSQAVAVVAEVDCLISLAMAAVEFGFNRPTMTTTNELRIQGGKQC